jgi:hypothetical protein
MARWLLENFPEVVTAYLAREAGNAGTAKR